MKTYAVVGDVHGDCNKLAKLLGRIPSRDGVIFVGDVIGRSGDSKSTLNLVNTLAASVSVVVVRGNHEAALLAYLKGSSFVHFAVHGGLSVLRSYVGFPVGDVRRQLADAIPEEHGLLLRNTVRSFRDGRLVVEHWNEAAERF